MKKLLSIIIPTYNAEKFLDKGLPSFLIENLPAESEAERERNHRLQQALEVLVVNDGTKDNSVAKAQTYVDRYPDTFRILNKENGGHGSAINAGVEAVTGEFFQVVDADDWVDTGVLAQIMLDLSKHSRDFDAIQADQPTTETSDAIQADQPTTATNDTTQPDRTSIIDDGFSEIDAMIHAHTTHNVTTGEIEHKHAICPDENKLYNLADIMEFWDDIFWNMTFHGVLYRTEFYRSQNYKLAEGVFYEDQEYSTIPLCFARRIQITDKELYQYRIGDVNQSVNKENLIKRLPHLETVIFKMAQAERFAQPDTDPVATQPDTDPVATQPDIDPVATQSDTQQMSATQSSAQQFAHFALGGRDYWLKKLTKCITDYYHVALIVNRDKKSGRRQVNEFNEKFVKEHPAIFSEVEGKYKVFKLINSLGMSEKGYDRTIGALLELRSKLRRN